MYTIAGKYGVGLLKDLAKARFALAMRDTVAMDIPSFIATIEVVYASTRSSDRGLRDCIKPKLVEFEQQLRDSNEFMALFEPGSSGGNFAIDVVDAWHGANLGYFDYPFIFPS